jgi:Undecaprenyl-phosphate galactose phosphotransferase WbaP
LSEEHCPNVQKPAESTFAAPNSRTRAVAVGSVGSGAFTQTRFRFLRITLLSIVDILFLFAAASLAYAVWALPVRGQSFAVYLPLAPLLTLFVIGYAAAGLYPGFGLGPVETLRRQSYVTAFGFVVVAAISFALKVPPLYSRVTFSIALVFSLVCVPAGRALISHLARRWSWWNEPVVVIGAGERAARAIRGIRQATHLGYQPVAVMSHGSSFSDGEIEGVAIVGGLEAAAELVRRGVRIALLEIDESQSRSFLDRLQQQFRHVILLRQHYDLPVEGLHVRNLGTLIGIEYTNNLLVHENRVTKRALDLLVGSIALVVAAPVVLIAAAAVKLVDGGAVFFFQDRAGLNGRRISVPKIRTMIMDAETALNDYLDATPGARTEWESRHKLRDDPRLIRYVGHLFRRFSIDELPQLWSVLVGDMSLVGPRPFPDYHLKKFSPDFLDLRQRARPGITGLWQVTVRSEGGIGAQEAYDSYYIRNWSVWLDLYLLSRTLGSVVSGRGAY